MPFCQGPTSTRRDPKKPGGEDWAAQSHLSSNLFILGCICVSAPAQCAPSVLAMLRQSPCITIIFLVQINYLLIIVIIIIILHKANKCHIYVALIRSVYPHHYHHRHQSSTLSPRPSTRLPQTSPLISPLLCSWPLDPSLPLSYFSPGPSHHSRRRAPEPSSRLVRSSRAPGDGSSRPEPRGGGVAGAARPRRRAP